MKEKELLIIVDMVNGFVKEGALADRKINHITKDILWLLKDFLKEGKPVVAFRDSHTPDCAEFQSFPVHCLRGSWESELIDE